MNHCPDPATNSIEIPFDEFGFMQAPSPLGNCPLEGITSKYFLSFQGHRAHIVFVLEKLFKNVQVSLYRMFKKWYDILNKHQGCQTSLCPSLSLSLFLSFQSSKDWARPHLKSFKGFLVRQQLLKKVLTSEETDHINSFEAD